MAVVITGIGALSPFGAGREALLRGLFAGASALGPRPELAGGTSAPVPGREGWQRPGKALRLALASAREALAEAGLPDEIRARVGLVCGTIVGEAGNGLLAQRPGLSEPRRQALLRAWSWAILARRLARRLGLGGAAVPVSTACASGADALGMGAREVASGRAPAVVAGGVEVLAPFQWEGFRKLGALDPERVRPFDRRRRGTGMGEGACFWVLEEEDRARSRGARVLGRLLGWATAADAVSLTAPEPEGKGLQKAARGALAGARVSTSEISFTLSHATGTVANDRAEARALRSLFGDRLATLPVTGIKGATGHCLGASAALEATAALLFLQEGRVPPVVGLEEVDPALHLRPVQGATASIGRGPALCLSSGFGGQNAALVLGGGDP